MVKQIDVHHLAGRLNAGETVHLLDVRQPSENQFAALPDSQLIPLNQLAARVDEIKREPGVPLIVYCHHGVRSLNAALFLEQQGHQEVYSLAGGIDAWSLHIDPQVPRYF